MSTETKTTTTTESRLEPEQPAKKERGEFRWRYLFLHLAQRTFLYFVLYALSIGPFYWTWYKSRFVSGSSSIAAFYEPLVWLANVVPPFGKWMNWYIHLWIG